MGIQGKRSPRGGEAKVNTERELIDIELELMKYFHFEKNIIAFNVMGASSVLPLAHEADMLVVSKSGYLTEVEIKRTLADFRADFKKSHRHESNGLLSEFVYCIPEGMLDKAVKELEAQRFVPTGLLLYDENLRLKYKPVRCEFASGTGEGEGCVVLRLDDPGKPWFCPAKTDSPKKLYIEQVLEIARLGAMRQFHLRERILDEKKKASAPDVRLENEIVQLKVLLREYRQRYKEDTGGEIDEREVLWG